MACDGLLRASLLQVVNRLVANLLKKTCHPQACCKLFQQNITNLQMITSRDKQIPNNYC